MGYAFRGDQNNAGGHRHLFAFEKEFTLALDDLIDLVHPGVRVECMLLSWLETVEAYQQALGFEECRFPHFGWLENGVVFRSDRYGVIHGIDFLGCWSWAGNDSGRGTVGRRLAQIS